MGNCLRGLLCLSLFVAVELVFARLEPRASASEEQTLTGEVVSVWCYLREGSWGTGRLNTARARNCIRLGSPIAIRVGSELYLVAVEDPTLKNRLTRLVGHQVQVHGNVTVRQGQPVMAISRVERMKPQP